MNLKSRNILQYHLFTTVLISLILWFAVIPGQMHAQVYPLEYIDEAIKNNPGLKAQHKAYEAALQEIDIAGGLPDPELSAGIFTPPMERLMGNQLFDARIMQMFPWFGTLEKQRSAARKMADANFQQYLNERNGLFMEMTRLWLNLYEKDQQINILLNFIEVLKARENIIYSRYEGGLEKEGLMLDLYRLEIQLNDLENKKKKLLEEKNALVKSFNILLNRERDAQITSPDTLTTIDGGYGRELTDTIAFEANPLVSRAQAEALAASYKKEVARLMTRPMIGLGLQYSHFAPGDAAMGQMDGGGMVMPMLSVSIPIYGKKNRAIRTESALREEQATHQKEEQINKLFSQAADLKAKHKNLERDIDFYQKQLDITNKTWDLVLNAYAGGYEGFDELLRIQDQLLEIQWRLLETTVEQNINAAEIDKLLGRGIFN